MRGVQKPPLEARVQVQVHAVRGAGVCARGLKAAPAHSWAETIDPSSRLQRQVPSELSYCIPTLARAQEAAAAFETPGGSSPAPDLKLFSAALRSLAQQLPPRHVPKVGHGEVGHVGHSGHVKGWHLELGQRVGERGHEHDDIIHDRLHRVGVVQSGVVLGVEHN